MIAPVVKQHFKYAKSVQYGFIMRGSWYHGSKTDGWVNWYRITKERGFKWY